MPAPAVCDPAGRMWAGTMAYGVSPGAGALHRWNTDGSVTCVLDGLPLPNGPVFRPDGMTVDSDGCIWSAIWGGSQIRRYSPEGQLLQSVDVPALQPTAVCLTGQHLIVTTAAYGPADPGPWDGAVLRASCTATAPVTPGAEQRP
ncbi:SMP-30/gluconolactonase/LRE family protein [Streptomyces sp. NPDC052309]|uniref:SMP-30/gluconolactonase/LRE family protein n=1 Tax=Streptomyces sp. NPDC052309 TaxID=3155421 RepID=UPI00343E7557